jgi:hypothetical protein
VRYPTEGATYPSADAVAIAIVAACRQLKEDPLRLFEYEFGTNRPRYLAYFALVKFFPDTPNPALGRMLGASRYRACNLKAEAITAKNKSQWWNQDQAEAVCAELEAFLKRRAGPLPDVSTKVAEQEKQKALVMKTLDEVVEEMGLPPPSRYTRPVRSGTREDLSYNFGDPIPGSGRSALEQRQAQMRGE